MASGFSELFRRATRQDPFPFQVALAEGPEQPGVIRAPTGSGKTAAAVLGWLYRRRFHPDTGIRRATPRRLVYCLPMRVLVEQTRDEAIVWLSRLDLLGGDAEIRETQRGVEVVSYKPAWEYPDRIVVSTIMGGEADGGWDLYPERDAILVGTQDMVLSRALNRGYGMSRYRWPMHFGLLNDDCLWVADEVQLFGPGLATTTQLQSLRRALGTHRPVRTLWMSATIEPAWLRTADVSVTEDVGRVQTLTSEDEHDPRLARRLEARKALARSEHSFTAAADLADEIVRAHRPGTRTLAVVNTVKRAVALYEALGRTLRASAATPSLVLVHSRFRPRDRQRVIVELLAPPTDQGTIVVSTQVIEAGVDITSAMLFTELAPWASLVQRFGRCNRGGELDAGASVYWIDLPAREDRETPEAYEKRLVLLAQPYEIDELHASRAILERCSDVGPRALPAVELAHRHGHVLRRRDLVELFDSTPDLTGHDIDISRFIREPDDSDVRVFWRSLIDGPSADEPQPSPDELCPVPIADIRALITRQVPMWHWDPLDEEWRSVTLATPIHPGLTLMLRAGDGRYTEREGWRPESRVAVTPLLDGPPPTDSRYSGDPLSERTPMTLGEHADRVVAEAKRIAGTCGLDSRWREALVEAARWHDAGKTHPIFQRTIRRGTPWADGAPILAKGGHQQSRYVRDVGAKSVRVPFRHDLVSGLLALEHGRPDLVAYLAASHHGKVRLSIRSLPNEPRPPDTSIRFARGVWDGDQTLPADLGGGIALPSTAIDLSCMELGDHPTRGSSWLARSLALRDDPNLGPFRLALLEALLKAADERASGAVL